VDRWWKYYLAGMDAPKPKEPIAPKELWVGACADSWNVPAK